MIKSYHSLDVSSLPSSWNFTEENSRLTLFSLSTSPSLDCDAASVALKVMISKATYRFLQRVTHLNVNGRYHGQLLIENTQKMSVNR